MHQIRAFILKEFKHVFRDRKTLLLLFGMPVVQIILFGFAITNEIKNSRIIVIDQARNIWSHRLIGKIDANIYFDVTGIKNDPREVIRAFRANTAVAALILSPEFGSPDKLPDRAPYQILTDASDPNAASLITDYLSAIIASERTSEINTRPPLQIDTDVRMLYNPSLKGAYNFVPGVMALVLLLICVMMTSISIVREKELGTMEVLLVSPFKPVYVIIAKVIPYFVVSVINLVVILLLSVFMLDMPVKGDLLLLLAESALFITTALSLGLLISNITSSQQVAMLISLMGMMLPTILFSGFMFPIENMPWPLQLISNLVPSKWFYIIVRSIMIKGLGLLSIWKETLILLVMTLFFIGLSLKKFSVRLQ